MKKWFKTRDVRLKTHKYYCIIISAFTITQKTLDIRDDLLLASIFDKARADLKRAPN